MTYNRIVRLPSSLKARISLLVVIPLAVQLALLGRLTYIQRQAEVALKNADEYSKLVFALYELNSQIISTGEQFYSIKMDINNAAHLIDEAHKTIDRFDHITNDFRALTKDDPQAAEDLDRFIELKSGLMVSIRGMAKSFIYGTGKDGRREFYKNFVQQLRDGAHAISTMETRMHSMANERLRKSRQFRAEEPILLGAFGVITALLGVVSTFALSHDASQKLANLRRNVSNLASGAELHPPAAGTDEIALIDKTFYETATSLRRAQANQRELVSMFTHDMRNPLTSMALALDTLSEKSELDPYKKKIDSLRNNTRRLSELISDLLDLYKSETGMMTFASETFTAFEVCTEAAHAIADAAHALNVELSTPPATAQTIQICGDRKATARALINLLSNAVKHSPSGSTIELTVNDNTAAGLVEFNVIDHGSGIPEAEQAAIFDRFQQASTAAQSRIPGLGSGLGLAICKTFAERQHGDVRLTSSTVGGGSTFTLRLPRAQV